MSGTSTGDSFTEEVHRLRDAYVRKKEESNLITPKGRPIVDLSLDEIYGVLCYTYWYEDKSPQGYGIKCVRLADMPGTLSGEILRLNRQLPETTGDYEVIGNDIRPLEHTPPLPQQDDDSEDTSASLVSLPEVDVSPDKHFVKRGKYSSEIQNLLQCQGGSCPGVPKSPNIVQLLGKTPNGELVFEKYQPRYILAFVYGLATYKSWILQVISGLKCLHSLGIVHRDLRIDNLVFSSDASRVLICDLESRWGNRLAPEVSRKPIPDAGWTEKSDIYDLGCLVRGLIYGNVPITNAVEWNVPPPLEAIVEACTHSDPFRRPSLDELYAMVEKIRV